MIHRPAVALLLLASIAIAACGAESNSPEPPIVLPLQTIPLAPNAACAGVGLAAILHGDPTDPEVVWLTGFPGAFGPARGDRIHVVWPVGYRARFDPALSIVDARGSAGLQEGDFIDGGCVTGIEDRLLIFPGPDGFQLGCGPMSAGECTIRVSQAGRMIEPNGRRLAMIRFLNADGSFEAVYEDGSIDKGFASSN